MIFDKNAETEQLNQCIDVLGNATRHIKSPILKALNIFEMVENSLEQRDDFYEIKQLKKARKHFYEAVRISYNMDLYTNLFIQQKEVEFVPTYLNELFRDILSSIALSLRGSNIKFDYKVTDTPIVSLVAPTLIGSMLMNIIHNSCTFVSPDLEIFVTIEEKDNGYSITVTDSGVGIESQDISRIFEAGHSHNPNDPVVAGIGLGLTVASEIIRRHSGNVVISSEENQGTTISMRFPINTPPRENMVRSTAYLNFEDRLSPVRVFMGSLDLEKYD